MTDPRHPSGPGSIQPGLHPQRPAGLQNPSHHVTPGLHSAQTLHPPHATPGVSQPARAAVRPADGDDPIALVEELTEEETSPAKKIKAFGEDGARKQHDWKRKTIANGQGACRMRSFHGKYSDQGLQYLDDAVNEWLDAHPEVEVKFVTSTVGVFEGKIREPALVLNLWY
jgi:hypothetical protein